ncbi:Transcriptional coactivator/pterin dehydratase [Artemisia annua]|uniref:Transcriptional coactivator/pterin dehydratase n=1 Tax=Artemisia annua TaxID=35608 RepID=A0A2U1L065_ARTAN|nr:Transcriptional coactivator/pterin dehydratase [Artemisia annua]
MAVITTPSTFTFTTVQHHNTLNFTHNHLLNLKFTTTRRTRTIGLALGNELLGDFGARDPFPAKIETNFCDKVAMATYPHAISCTTVYSLKSVVVSKLGYKLCNNAIIPIDSIFKVMLWGQSFHFMVKPPQCENGFVVFCLDTRYIVSRTRPGGC